MKNLSSRSFSSFKPWTVSLLVAPLLTWTPGAAQTPPAQPEAAAAPAAESAEPGRPAPAPAPAEPATPAKPAVLEHVFEEQEPKWNVNPDPTANETIRQSVWLAMVGEPLAYSASPQIAVEGQVVTLTGVVLSEEARAAAEKAARTVPEVTDVRNQLEVRPPPRPATLAGAAGAQAQGAGAQEEAQAQQPQGQQQPPQQQQKAPAE